jgi:hypothetical protein
MAKPCSVFTAAIGVSANAVPVMSSESKQIAMICRNGVSEKPTMTAPSAAGQTRANSGSPQRSYIAHEGGHRFEPVSLTRTIRQPELGATRPARSAEGAVDVTVASFLSIELRVSGSGGGVTSGDDMSALPEPAGNARWL